MTTDLQGEMLTQVDLQNNIIGTIERGKAHSFGNLIYRTVYVFVKNFKEEILIQKRSGTKDLYPNCWDISVGGHVTYGDSYEESAIREIKEELGIVAEINDLKVVGDVLVILPSSKEFFRVYEYNLKERDKIVLEHKEIAEIKWMSIENIKDSIKTKSLTWYARPIQTIEALY